jgi:hypothetical protein
LCGIALLLLSSLSGYSQSCQNQGEAIDDLGAGCFRVTSYSSCLNENWIELCSTMVTFCEGENGNFTISFSSVCSCCV